MAPHVQTPDQGKTPINDTRIRVLFDTKNIYIGAFCPDSLGRRAPRVPDLRRDFDYFANDLVGVSFDPFRDQRNAQAFQTNPFGAQRGLRCADGLGISAPVFFYIVYNSRGPARTTACVLTSAASNRTSAD